MAYLDVFDETPHYEDDKNLTEGTSLLKNVFLSIKRSKLAIVFEDFEDQDEELSLCKLVS